MFILEVDHPDPRLGREYIRDGAGIYGDPDPYTHDVAKARLFVERGDARDLPWPANEDEAAELEAILRPTLRPKRIPVFYCVSCARLSLTPLCGSCTP